MKRILGLVLLLIGVLVFWPSGGIRNVFSAAEPLETLVIDAGQGGFDGGAVGAGGVNEQGINLRIAKHTEALAGFFGIPTVMTRSDENALGFIDGRPIRENKVSDIHERQRIAEETENPVFLSIHLNKFEQTQYHGAQVFYSRNNPRSKQLAEALQAALIEGSDPSNHRQAKQAANTIYLMKKLECPAVIAECGFLSNPAEAERLQQEEYQKQLAVCIIGGYLRYRGEI